MASQGAPGTPRHYAVSELKNRILNIAQTSVYHVKFGLPASASEFLGNSARGITDGVISDIELLCSEASLPGSGLATHDVTNDYHGVAEKMAYRRLYDESIDLTFYVDRDYNVIEFFDGWINYIVGEGTTFSREQYKDPYVHYRMNYPVNYRSTLYIVKFEKDQNISNSMTYTFVNAFPTNIISMPVSYEQSQLLKCTVSFSYTRYVRERIFNSIPQTLPDPRSPGVVERNANNFEPVKPTEFNVDKLIRSSSGSTPEYYNNFGSNRQNATNFSDFTDGSNTGPFGQAVA
jgi:hypothetical protein